MSDLDKNKNNIEENNKNKKPVDLKADFIKELTKKSLSWSDKNTFLDEVMKNDTIASGSYIEKEIQKFQAGNDKFNSFDEKKINIFDLKRAVSKEYLSLENSRKNYIESTLSNYDLNDKQRKKLEKEIENKSVSDLENLISRETENKKFLDKIFGENKINKNIDSKFLDFLSEKEINSRLNKLSWDSRKEVELILSNLNNFSVKDADIRDLFNYNFLKESEKKEIISKYIPYISLAKASEIWLIDSKKEKEIKEKKIKEILWSDLSWNELDDAIENASSSDIKIETKDFLNSVTNLNKLANEVWFSNLEKDFNDFKEDLKQDINKNWPQNLEELRTVLSWEEFSGNFENLWNFKEWNFIKISSKNESWKEVITYWKIESTNLSDKEVSIRWIWDNATWKEIINLDSYSNSKALNFNDIISNFKSWTKKASFLTETDILKLIDSGNLETSDLKQYTPKDLQNDPELVNKLQEQYKENTEKERQILEEEISSIEEEIKSLKDSKNDENKAEINSQLEILNIKLGNRKLRLNSFIESTDSSISTNDLLQYSNKIELNKKLDEIDPEGKWIELAKGWFISTKDWIYEITWIDWETGEIHLLSNGKNWPQPEKLTFEGFYEAFKKNKATRVKPMKSLEDLIEDNKENSEKKEFWNNVIVKNWKLQIKDVPEYSKDTNPEIEFLVSDNSDDIFKIEKIDWDKITFKWWERKDINSLDEKEQKKFKKNIKIWKDWKPEKKDWKFQYEWELLRLSKNTETLSLSEFNKLINKKKEEFYPDWQTWKQKTEKNIQDSENWFKGSFMTRLFNNLSISEVIMWWKMLTENIEEYFKKWNDIHAAKVALKFGKMLPDEVYQDLQIKVERAESESMDKEIESLWKVDSPIATKRILDWLLNTDTAEYKKEAWLMFMIKKYGHLNSKEIYKAWYAWKFLWYEAFGWKVWDEFFLDMKNQAEEKNQTFSEEFLMYIFIKKQCWSDWFKWIKRRTRLHKEYKANWPNWVEEEVKTGYTDASDERRAIDMVGWWIWEMEGGTHSNAVWWFEKAIERWGSLEDMSEGFFTMLYSWAIYNMDQKTYLKIKWLWDWKQMPMIMARFSSYKSDMDLFNETVLELSKRIWDEYPNQFPEIKERAQKLYLDAKNGNWYELDRIKRARSFWKDYGTPLSRALNMNTLWDSNTSKTDKILILEKEQNPTFKKYFESVRSFTTESTFGKDFMDDAMWMEWVAWLNIHENLKKYAQLYTGWTLKNDDKNIVEKIWWWLSEDINSVYKKDFIWWEQSKRKYLDFILRDIISAFLINNAGDYLGSFAERSPFKDDLLKWWLIKDILLQFNNTSSETILDWTSELWNTLISKIVDNILSWNWISNSWEFFQAWLEPVKEKTDEILNKNEE